MFVQDNNVPLCTFKIQYRPIDRKTGDLINR